MHTVKSELKSVIVYEIEHVFGRRVVSSRDCIDLSDEIYIKTQQQLNPNTLRRFFSLVKADYPPSQATLNILSKYCGFQSIDDIYRVKNTESIDEGSVNPENIMRFLVSIFRNTEVKDNYDHTFLNVIMQTIKFLNANKFLTDRFQSLIAKTENGNNFYFEQLVNVDKLNSFYGNGLRYYLQEKGTADAEVFTASLNVLKYWLSGEDQKLIKCAIGLNNPDAVAKMHPYTVARQFAALLFTGYVAQSDSEVVRITIHNYYEEIASAPVNRKFLRNFTCIVSEALLMTRHDAEALYYLRETKKYGVGALIEDPLLNYTQSFNLIEAFALYNLGENKKAEKKFNEIKSSEFPFLNKRLCCILYILLLKKIKAREKDLRYEDQLQALVKETGFKRLLVILQ
ncbi:MAG: hypothetical protein ABIX01_08415 [Chitinophagaceae bacterium]